MWRPSRRSERARTPTTRGAPRGAGAYSRAALAEHGAPLAHEEIDAAVDERGEHHQQQDGRRGAEAELVELPHLPPEVEGDRLRRVARPPEREQHRLVEDLQRLHAPDDD